jgi:hypothetical protein
MQTHIQTHTHAHAHTKTHTNAPAHTQVSWYAENQELLSRNDALVREQQDVIGQLEHRVAMHEGGWVWVLTIVRGLFMFKVGGFGF